MADLRGDSEEPQGDGVEAMEISGSSTSTVDTPLPVPEPVDDETDMQDGKLMALATHTHIGASFNCLLLVARSDGGVDSGGEDDETVDLSKMAEDYAHYLVVNSKQDVCHCGRDSHAPPHNAHTCTHPHRPSSWMSVLRVWCFVWRSSSNSCHACTPTSLAPLTR